MRYFIFSTILFLASSGFAKGKPDTLKQIKTEKLTSYEAANVDGEIIKGKRGWYLYFLDDEYNEYNRSGDAIKTIYWNEDQELEEISTTTYGENGEIIKMTDFIINENGDTVMDYLTKYYYDHKGFCYLDSSFNGDYSLNLYSKSAYDYNQNISVSKTLYPDASVLMFYYQYYNDADELIKTETRDENNQLESTTHYIRDTVENYYSYCTITDDDTTSYLRTDYDENGLPIQETNYYKDQGNDHEVHSFEYLLNKHGDWIKQYIYRKGKLIYVVERELTYWEE